MPTITKYNPNTKRYEEFEVHDDAAGADLLSKERLQSALGLSGKGNTDTSGDEPEPNYSGMSLAKMAEAKAAWKARKAAKAKPSPAPVSANAKDALGIS